jgi:hypothetical protein
MLSKNFDRAPGLLETGMIKHGLGVKLNTGYPVMVVVVMMAVETTQALAVIRMDEAERLKMLLALYVIGSK